MRSSLLLIRVELGLVFSIKVSLTQTKILEEESLKACFQKLEENKRDLAQQGLLLYCKVRDQRNFAKGKNPGGGKLESLLSKAWRK